MSSFSFTVKTFTTYPILVSKFILQTIQIVLQNLMHVKDRDCFKPLQVLFRISESFLVFTNQVLISCKGVFVLENISSMFLVLSFIRCLGGRREFDVSVCATLDPAFSSTADESRSLSENLNILGIFQHLDDPTVSYYPRQPPVHISTSRAFSAQHHLFSYLRRKEEESFLVFSS